LTASPQTNGSLTLPENIAQRYLVQRQLGAGGMGEAYLANDTLLHRQVVIKRMSPELSRNPLDRQRFLSEAKRAAAINNTHVVQIYDVLEANGELLLILEYVDGSNLRSMRGQKLAPDQFFPMALHIAEGVAAAHSAHVVHCDLKPENILIARSGDIKILDFGLARPTSRHDAATVSLTQPKFAGTPGYMAPEMIREQDIDERADIFALGVIFYELLSGIAPFTCPTLLDTLHKTVNDDPPPVTGSNPNIPPEIDWILSKMLAKDRDERYSTLHDVITDLNACQRKLNGTSGNTRISVTAPPTRPSRMRYAIAAIALLMVVAIAGVIFYWKKLSPPQPEVHYRSVAVLPFRIIGESQPRLEAYADGICATLTSKLGRIASDHQLQITPVSEVRRRSLSDASAAKQQLGVDLVIEGEVQRNDKEVRINYSLVDTRTMSTLSSGDTTAKMDDPFTLEDQIVTAALHMLDVQLETAEAQSIALRGTTNPAAYDLFLIGTGYLREYEDPGSIQRAIESFQGALIKDADYAQADAALGRAYWRKYQLTHDASFVEQARAACQSAVKKNSALPDSHLCLGIIASGTGQYEAAVKELETAVAAEPSNDVALRELARTYEKLKQPAEAEQVYKRSILARPHYWAGYDWLGSFYARQARYEEAAAQFKLAIEQSPGNSALYSSLGGIYILEGKNDDAVAMLKKAVELQPSPDDYQNLGQTYLHARNFEEAIKAFKQAIVLGDQEYEIFSGLGDAYFWSHTHNDEAAAAYRQSNQVAIQQQRVDARDQGLNIILAYNHAALGEEAQALEYLKRAQKDNPRDRETMFFAARIYARLNHPTEAADWLRQAIENGYSKADIQSCPDLDGLLSQPAIRKAMAN
jgi:serine/threonine protein kinase/tetratricopeptide (TPR) repeat protein